MASVGISSTPRFFVGKRRLVFSAIILTNFVVWLDTAKFGVLNPFWSKDLNLEPSQISSVAASYLLGYFPMLFLAGILADRFGARRMLLTCVSGVTVLSASMAAVHTYGEMWWRNFVFGLFFGLLWAPCTRLLANWFPGQDNAKATSMWMSSTLLAGVVAPAIALPLANHLSWQAAFLVVAALGIPAFVMLWMFAFDDHEKVRGISADEVNSIRTALAIQDENSKLSFGEILRLLRRPSIITMALATALATTPTWLTGPWMPYGLITLDKVNPDVVAWVTPLIALIPVLFGLVNGTLVARLFGGRTRPWLAFGPLLGAVGFAMAIVMHDTSWVLWAIMLGGVAFLCDPMFWGTVNSYWVGIAGPKATGTLNGVSAALQVGVGWYITNQSGQWLNLEAVGRAQLDRVWLIGAIIFAVAIIPVLISREIRVRAAGGSDTPSGAVPVERPA